VPQHQEVIMKKSRVIPLLLVTAAAVVLAACTTSPQAATSYVSDSAYPMVRYEVDSDYVNAVERQARHRGVTVEWLQPPRRPVRQQLPADE
jgi:starvation-inducible outer membrane lipoprotein